MDKTIIGFVYPNRWSLIDELKKILWDKVFMKMMDKKIPAEAGMGKGGDDQFFNPQPLLQGVVSLNGESLTDKDFQISTLNPSYNGLYRCPRDRASVILRDFNPQPLLQGVVPPAVQPLVAKERSDPRARTSSAYARGME